MLEETIQGLNIKDNGIYVDGTLGGAGHSKEIWQKCDENISADEIAENMTMLGI